MSSPFSTSSYFRPPPQPSDPLPAPSPSTVDPCFSIDAFFCPQTPSSEPPTCSHSAPHLHKAILGPLARGLAGPWPLMVSLAVWCQHLDFKNAGFLF